MLFLLFPAANQGANILSTAFDSSFLMLPLVETDESADTVTAKGRAGIYYLDWGNLEMTADDIRLVAKLTAGDCFGFILFEHGRLSGFFKPASVRYYYIC